MRDNEQRSPEPWDTPDETPDPEGEAYFNSVVERYRNEVDAAPTRGKTPRTAPDPGPAAIQFVLCASCGSNMPAVNRLCYVCGAIRSESDNRDVRVATAAPDLRVNKHPAWQSYGPPVQPGPASIGSFRSGNESWHSGMRSRTPNVDPVEPERSPFETYSRPASYQRPSPRPAAEPEIPVASLFDSYYSAGANDGRRPRPPAEPAPGASPFETYYRPNTTEAAPVQRERAKRDYQSFIVTGLLAVLVLGGLVAVWRTRHVAAGVVADVRRNVAAELEDLWSSPATMPQAPYAAPAPRHTRAPARPSTWRPSPSAPVEKAPASHDAALRVRVEGQPGPAFTSAAPVTNTGYRTPAEVPAADAGLPPVSTVPTAGGPMRVWISPRESLQMLIRQRPPVYPEEARARHAQGQVALKIIIGRDGRVRALEPLSGEGLLVPAAMDAVRQWLYRPYLVDGLPQEVETMVVLDFSLADASAAAVPQPAAALP